MHTIETKNQFIELRANGLSFDAIAEKLNVSKSTLLRWHRDCDAEIRALRAIELDAVYDEMFLPHKNVADCLSVLQAKLEHELAHRDLRALPTPQLLRAATQVRKEIRDLRKHTVHAFLTKPTATPVDVAQPPATEPYPTTPPINEAAQ